MNVIYARTNNKVRIILIVAIILSLCFMFTNIFLSYDSTIRTVEISIATQSMKTAADIAREVDVSSFERFLQKPTEDSTDYIELNHFLNDYRIKIGAKHVYLVIMDAQGNSRVMINGLPPGDSAQTYIGELCTLTMEEVQPAYHDDTFHTGIIHDPKYGVYMTAGAPLVNASGQLVGIVGIDIGVELLEQIEANALNNSLFHFAANLVVLILIVVSYTLIRRWYQRETLRAVGDSEQTFQREFRAILTSIQSIRHDFANHLQVLFGLLELKKVDRAQEYLRGLQADIQALTLSEQVANPALLVLLHSKAEKARCKSIEMDFHIPPDETFDGVLSSDLIKILSNLLDNAIEAADEDQRGEKRISLTMQKVGNSYQFMVENTGPTLAPEVINKLTEAGFTTKETEAGKARGYGLGIVREVVHKYAGEMHITSARGKTCFSILLSIADRQ
ncbi:sensor histidine kinase [Brevibacillus choshinensis]|uniref:GHKL domain-containing protein n=1 Tax=Brevibacillus choshinensis TaxID=54911 RepID=A0ABX7FKN7_BRECH|nr:GHKL domain-containing protein [Brevibacillus choshinensis]QRG66200.1 GHKL domain-containing protein [Brevibacillus choshinensis]